MKKVPKLRFKEFSDEWEEYELGDIIEISKQKYNPIKNKENYKCIEMENLSQFTGRLLGYTSSNEQKSIKNIFSEGQVLFGKLRPYLKKYWLCEFDGVCSSEIWVLYSNSDKICNNFVHIVVQMDKFNFIANISAGTKMPRADWNYMSEFPFLVPSLEEQEKISKFLSLIDRKIELQREKVRLLKEYKKGMMSKIFKQEIRFKDENGQAYPDWEEKRFVDIIVEKKKGKNPSYSEVGNILLNNEYMESNKIMFVENATDVFYEDILILWDGVQAGKVYTGFSGVLGSTFIGITLKKEFNNKFIYQQLRFNLYKIKKFWIEGSGIPHVAKDFIEKFILRIPCIKEQKKIGKFLSLIDKKLEKSKEKLDLLIQYKKGLLQQMFV